MMKDNLDGRNIEYLSSIDGEPSDITYKSKDDRMKVSVQGVVEDENYLIKLKLRASYEDRHVHSSEIILSFLPVSLGFEMIVNNFDKSINNQYVLDNIVHNTLVFIKSREEAMSNPKLNPPEKFVVSCETLPFYEHKLNDSESHFLAGCLTAELAKKGYHASYNFDTKELVIDLKVEE